VDLGAVDGDAARGFDPEADLVADYTQNRNRDLFTDVDRLRGTTGENEHAVSFRWTLSNSRAGRISRRGDDGRGSKKAKRMLGISCAECKINSTQN
jgi:hypothetical protein